MFKNEYESTSYDYALKDGKKNVRMDIRWTVEGETELDCLIALRERIADMAYNEEMDMQHRKFKIGRYAEKPSGQEETALM